MSPEQIANGERAAEEVVVEALAELPAATHEDLVVEDLLVEDVSIDGMCGVY
jgi:mycofactocin precursor